MTAGELIKILNCVKPETEICMKTQRDIATDSSNITIEKGYFVKDSPDFKIGSFVLNKYAFMIQDDGKLLLDLNSENISDALFIGYKLY